jgi:adenine-specific DNA-methyltransferase
MMDEIFGSERFRNEIVWKRSLPHNDAKKFGAIHDTILFYTRGENYTFNQIFLEQSEEYKKSHYTLKDPDGRIYRLQSLSASGPGPARRFGERVIHPPKGTHWRFSQEKIDELLASGLIVFTSTGQPNFKRYLDQSKGSALQSIWTDVNPLNPQALERLDYPTQKPETLLERIIRASSKEGDLVADFFAGSGTAAAVAEKLGRRWIACDFSKTSIQIARNRFVQNETKPFLVENIGNYQRQLIYLTGSRITDLQSIVLKLYGALPRKDHPDLGTRKVEDQNELVYVSYPDRPVSARKAEELESLAEHLDGRGYDRLVILGWDYEYNYDEILRERERSSRRKWRIQIVSKTIPPEVYEYLKKAKTAADLGSLEGEIRFHDKPYLKILKPDIKKSTGKNWSVTVGIDRYVVFDFPVEKEEQKTEIQDIVKDKPLSLIDYWAVDWNYDGLTFKSGWQAMRRMRNKLMVVPKTATQELEAKKLYTIAVRVVDIFGNDAAGTVQVDLRGMS